MIVERWLKEGTLAALFIDTFTVASCQLHYLNSVRHTGQCSKQNLNFKRMPYVNGPTSTYGPDQVGVGRVILSAVWASSDPKMAYIES